MEPTPVAGSTSTAIATTTFHNRQIREHALRVLSSTEELFWACDARNETPAATRLYYTRLLHAPASDSHAATALRAASNAGLASSPGGTVRSRGKARAKARAKAVGAADAVSDMAMGGAGHGVRVLRDAVAGEVLPAKFTGVYVATARGMELRSAQRGEEIEGREGMRREKREGKLREKGKERLRAGAEPGEGMHNSGADTEMAVMDEGLLRPADGDDVAIGGRIAGREDNGDDDDEEDEEGGVSLTTGLNAGTSVPKGGSRNAELSAIEFPGSGQKRRRR